MKRILQSKQLVIDTHMELTNAQNEYHFAIVQQQTLMLEYNHIMGQQ